MLLAWRRHPFREALLRHLGTHHTVPWRPGLGLNSGFEDISVLDQCRSLVLGPFGVSVEAWRTVTPISPRLCLSTPGGSKALRSCGSPAGAVRRKRNAWCSASGDSIRPCRLLMKSCHTQYTSRYLSLHVYGHDLSRSMIVNDCYILNYLKFILAYAVCSYNVRFGWLLARGHGQATDLRFALAFVLPIVLAPRIEMYGSCDA